MLSTPPRPPSRSEIQRYVAELAHAYGWRHHRSPPALTLDGYADGFPLDVLVRGKRLVLIAAPSSGKVTPPEHAWARDLAQVETVEMHTVQRNDLGALGDVLRRPSLTGSETRVPESQDASASPHADQRALPKAVLIINEDVPPGQRSGRQKPSHAPSGQEEA